MSSTPEIWVPEIWVPDRFQLRARNFLKARLNAGLFLFPGFGKTSIALSAYIHLRRKQKLRRILVVTPVRPMYNTWPSEISQWLQFSGLTYSILHGKKKDEAYLEQTDIHLINYDGLAWLNSKRIPKGKYDLVIVDESSNVKHTTSGRSKAMKALRKKIPYSWIMNGSPISRNYMDLFGQCLIMDGGKLFGTRIGEFREKYFRRSGWGNHDWSVKRVGKKQIKERIAPVTFSLSEKDHLDLPPLIVKDQFLDFSPGLMRKYKHFLKESILKIGGGKVTAANAGALTFKALQFTGGNIYLDNEEDDRRIPYHIHDLKENHLVELIEELQGNPLLIGYQYKHELARLQQILRRFIDPVPVMNDPRNTKMIEDWNNNRYPLMLGYPRSMAHGLNLQKFKEGIGAIYIYTPTHNFEYYDQFIRRIRRRGFDRPVVVYRPLIRNTIDLPVIQCLAAKENNQEDFMNYIIRYWKDNHDQI